MIIFENTMPINMKNEEKEYFLDKYEKGQKWSIKDFEIGTKIGSGRFGDVYLGREIHSKYKVALKVMLKTEIQKAKLEHQIKREINIQQKIDHPNIISLFGHFEDSLRIYLILEYASKGDLFNIITLSSDNILSENKVKVYVHQLVKGVVYLRLHNVMHRDLKLENLLIDENDVLKISDFGWAAKGKDERTTLCGTLDYLSPEIVVGKSYDHSIDVWAIGILIYEMLAGYPPFISNTYADTYRKISNVEIDFPKSFSKKVINLLKKILVKNPQNRITPEDILKHIWFKTHLV